MKFILIMVINLHVMRPAQRYDDFELRGVSVTVVVSVCRAVVVSVCRVHGRGCVHGRGRVRLPGLCPCSFCSVAVAVIVSLSLTVALSVFLSVSVAVAVS